MDSFHNLLKKVKLRLLKMHYESRVGHIGGNLSSLDSLLLLHSQIMKEEDIFILSKGHAAGALYVVLWAVKKLSEEQLGQFHQDGTKLAGHPPPLWIPEIPIATGSLGHGFPVACGIAMAKKLNKTPGRVYCLMSDGEWQEGSNWEALIFASHQKLNNLTILIDLNGLQGFGTTSEVASMAKLSSRLERFDVSVHEVDGHDHHALGSTLNNNPSCLEIVIMHTVKGNGVSYMENSLDWHYLPMTEELYQIAKDEVSKS